MNAYEPCHQVHVDIAAHSGDSPVLEASVERNAAPCRKPVTEMRLSISYGATAGH